MSADACRRRPLRRLPRPARSTAPPSGVLRITLDGPGLNATGPAMHRQLADVWLTVDRDPDTHVGRAAGRRQGVLGRRQLRADRRHRRTTTPAGCEVMREARDLVFNVINCSKPIVSAMHGPAVGAGLVAGLLADVSVVVAHGEDHRRPHPPRRRRRRPRRDLLAAAVRHGEGEVLPADVRPAERARRPSASGSCRCASTTTQVHERALGDRRPAGRRRPGGDPLHEADAEQLVPRQAGDLRRQPRLRDDRLRRPRRPRGPRQPRREAPPTFTGPTSE